MELSMYWKIRMNKLAVLALSCSAAAFSPLMQTYAYNLLDPSSGAQITAIDKQLNATSWAAANLNDGNLSTRWLSSQQTNDLNFIFNSAKKVACFNRVDLNNYGKDDRSIRRFMLFRTLDAALSADTGQVGWTPIAADLNPVDLVNHVNWGQGGRLTGINSELNSTSWAAANIHDGDYVSRWLSNKANNQLEFTFDTNWDGVANDEINIKQLKIYNYGSDDRSLKEFQIETTSDGISWEKVEVPGSAAGEPDFNFALSWHGASLSAISRQLNSTSWAAKNIHDGDNNTRWLSDRGSNTLDFVFDVDMDGTTGKDGDADDLFTMDKFILRNYGVDERSIKNFQIEVKTSSNSNWTKLKVPGSSPGEADYNYLLNFHGGLIENIDSQLNSTSWGAKNIHDGDPNTRWLSSKGNNTLDFAFDVNLDGTSGAGGDNADLFTMKKFFLRNYGNDVRSVKLFQVEVKTAANNNWHKIEVPGSGANQAGYNFVLKANGGTLDTINRELNSTSWGAKNIHDGDNNTRWLSNKQDNTLEFSFDTDIDGSTGNEINLDTLSFVNYGNDDRSVQTFEIDIKISGGAWQTVNAPGGGTIFNANMDANVQSWSIGPYANVTDTRMRTISNYGDPSYTGAREIVFSGLSVGPAYNFTAAMHGNGETFALATPMVDVKNIRFRSINNYGDISYTGAREFEILGDSITENYTFTADMNGDDKTFTLAPGEEPVNVTEVRFRTINNYGDPSYTGAREFSILGDSLGAGYTFSLPMTIGPHTIILDNDDVVTSSIGVRLNTINNHGDPSYTGMRELELIGDPVGPDYIFKADMNASLQSFNFTPSIARVFRLHTLSNHGDPSYTGAAELALQSSNNCIMSEWRMDEFNWAGSANEVKDNTGNAFHGAAQHNVTTVDGTDPLVNGGICHTGSFNDDGYVELPTFPNFTESFTLTGWFNTSDNSERGQRIFADDETSTGGFAISVGDPGTGRMRFYHRSLNPVSLDTKPNLIQSNQWYFTAAVLTLQPNNKADKELYLFDATGNLLDYQYKQASGTIQASTGKASLGGEVDGAEVNNRFKGYLDEVKVFKGALAQTDIQSIVDFERVQKNWDGSSRACAGSTALDHIEIIHDGQGITCAPESITLKACINPDCSTLFTGDVNVTLLPGDPNSAWTGTATISNGSASLQLSHTVPGNVILGIASSNPVTSSNVVCNNGGNNDCTMSFSESGFIFSMTNQNSCKQSTNYIEIEAVKKSDSGVSCVPAFSGNRNVRFSTTYNSPASGSKKIAITPLGGSEELNPDTNPVAIDFDSGNNKFKARYNDAGQVTLTANYLDADGLALNGSQTFIVTPDHLSVLAKLPGAGGATLDAILPSGSPVRKAATDIFEVEVMAMCDDGTTQAKNFHAEVLLSGELPMPLPGFLGALGGDIDRNDFIQTAGVFDKLLFDDISYSEVGYFTLRADVTDYLGTGVNLTGTQVTGRFTPDHFTLISPYNVTTATDWGGSFVYMDQPKIKIEYVLEAQNGNNIITQNYNAGFAPSTVSASAENNDDANELSGRLSSFSGAWLNGQITFNMDNILFSRNSSPDGPYSLLDIGLKVDDQELGIDILLQNLDMSSISSGICDPLTTCSAKKIGSTDVRYGRLLVENAYGPVNLALSSVKIQVEYYDSNQNLFKINSDDSTTAFDSTADIDWNVASYSGLSSGDVESTGSGTLNSGLNSFSIHKTGSPILGPGMSGYADYRFTTQNWLKFDWKGSGDESPEARASFGIFSRSKRLIFTREVY